MMIIAIGGIGSFFFGLIWEISLQERVPKAAFGRVTSLDMLGSIALMPLGYLMTGWLADWMGGVQKALLLAIVMLIIIIGALSFRSIRQFN
ncbi:hypothetical protein [Pullulanibacillus camelliae]|nr:hypothetical protein [Pullulanibacillus camelliae]